MLCKCMFIRNWHPISQSGLPFLFPLTLWEYSESSVSLTAFGVANFLTLLTGGISLWFQFAFLCWMMLSYESFVRYIYDGNIFSQSVIWLFFFSFVISAFCVIAKKFSFYQRLQSYFIMNFSRSFINLAFMFKSMSPLELILAYNME